MILDTLLGMPSQVSIIIFPVKFPIRSWWLILEINKTAVMESILGAHAGISASPTRTQESF